MAGAQNDGLSVAERRRQKEAERQAAANGGAAGNGEIAITELAHNPRNARAALEEIEGLADTYATVGVLQSCAVIPAATFRAAFPEHDDDIATARYVVIGGNRRLAAARHAGLAKLPILVNTKAQTRRDILIAAATENLAREELKPLEELATIEELKEVLGTYDAVAQQLGKSAGWVSQRRRLHNLQPEVREALEARADGMTIELARELGKIKDREWQLKAWEDERRLAAERAADPKAMKQDKGKKARKKVPAQGGSGAGKTELDAEAKARREACALAVGANEGDPTRVFIIALQSPVSPDEAVALASHWVAEAGGSATSLHLSALAGEDGSAEQHQAALALALAHCELYMTRTNGSDTAHARAFVEWLETYADYQPADDAVPAATA
ncbi:ParB/RepB/Spo0J family partition protein [Streptomyces sp. ISL-36]|uniref:ParB/RepB/Spo0J family partition protein n=1 Tax=Streptomyces sp. ISL-36 TaxID=2819182 RepID=UPI001BE70632|nr:ParB/RepB/Spo0J family partition protein [Streptomyces sp. ISL-36]MBT2439832.1 ParB/RepB/Spo0J family partition protein [Streptomyces sp. ISL-36]